MNWFWKRNKKNTDQSIPRTEFIKKFESYSKELIEDPIETKFFMIVGRGDFLGKAIKADDVELEIMFAHLFKSYPEIKDILRNTIDKYDAGQIQLPTSVKEGTPGDEIKEVIKDAERRAEKRGVPVIKPHSGLTPKYKGLMPEDIDKAKKLAKDHRKKYESDRLSDTDISDILKNIK